MVKPPYGSSDISIDDFLSSKSVIILKKDLLPLSLLF